MSYRAAIEKAQYLALGQRELYSVVYECEAPAACVLLCGPFATDRLYSLAGWVKWGRFLASRNVLAARFDYTGTGESTGQFSEITFRDWIEDIQQASAWLRSNYPAGRLVLHGLGMGALLAQKAFAAGSGDALLMWSPPLRARDVLKQGLMARLSMDMILLKHCERKSAQEYIGQVKAGEPLEVDGYRWSAELWNSSEALALDSACASEGEGVESITGRPWNHIELGENMAPLMRSVNLFRAMNPRAAIVPEYPLNPDFTEFFGRNLDWILKRVIQKPEHNHA
ncbi:MAG TPA: alpha/beta hydrolase [Verrucomicrobiae bacterium]|nr:alpha/beta hydrolase [Verrucomicrobiae bacterium]